MESIYARAKKMEPLLFFNEIVALFQEELDQAGPITFETAAMFDHTYFDCNGEYWMKAYNYPRIGDRLSIGVVSKVGLLTFLTD
jgi:hypothetical protein